MKGKIINQNGMFYIKYIVESSESDEVEQAQVRLTLADHYKIREGNEVEFEIGDNGIATLK